jgi:hypothetical protein
MAVFAMDTLRFDDLKRITNGKPCLFKIHVFKKHNGLKFTICKRILNKILTNPL